jgi:putative SOS response-associated peptidase YedK
MQISIAAEVKASLDALLPPEIAAEMMKPKARAVEAWEVAAEVGNVKNNRPELMERAGGL